MAGNDKKRKKLQAHIEQMERDVQTALAKKESKTAEIDVPGMMRKIQAAKAQLALL